jgi:hypothetical protein
LREYPDWLQFPDDFFEIDKLLSIVDNATPDIVYGFQQNLARAWVPGRFGIGK